MTAKEAIKKVMKSKKVTQSELAERIGKKQNNLSMYLHSDLNMKLINLMQIVNECGFDVVLVNREDPSESYMIGDEVSQQIGPGDESFEARVREIIADELSKRGDPTPSSEK